MTTNVNFNLDEPKDRVLRRSDLKPGTAFVSQRFRETIEHVLL
jgi:hypothetical protein